MLKQNRRNIPVTAYAAKLLARRGYSKQELRCKLLASGYDETAIDYCITYLCERGYLNDLALCEILFQKYLKSNKYGVHGIRRKLQQAGFSAELVCEIMKSYGHDHEFTVALHLVERNFKGTKSLTGPKVARFLSVRGFSTGIISKVMEKSGFADDI